MSERSVELEILIRAYMAAMCSGMSFSQMKNAVIKNTEGTNGRRTLTVAHSPTEPSVSPKMKRMTDTRYA